MWIRLVCDGATRWLPFSYSKLSLINTRPWHGFQLFLYRENSATEVVGDFSLSLDVRFAKGELKKFSSSPRGALC